MNNRAVEYKRNLGESYMVITEDIYQGFELKMVREHKIYGLLPLQSIENDGKMQYWYHITGKKSLDLCFQEHKPGKEFLCMFLEELRAVIKQIGPYLLCEDGILLDPEYIYMAHNNKKIYFCYAPFCRKTFLENFREFMEYFLQKMDHEDEAGIKSAYGIYERCVQDNFSIEELIRIAHGEVEEKWEKSLEEQEMINCIGSDENKIQEKQDETGEQQEAEKGQRTGIFNFLPFKKKKNKIEDMVCIFEPEKEEEEEVKNPTVCLNTDLGEILGTLVYEGSRREESFYIKKSPYLIGADKNEADGIMRSPAISRCHARITIEHGLYYIEDWNSTNGTYVDGKILNYKEKCILNKNAIVRFADEEYRFI